MKTKPNIMAPVGVIKRLGRPPLANSQKVLCARVQVSVRSMQRLLFIDRYGVPELAAMARREKAEGGVSFSAAEHVAHLAHKVQRQLIKAGASAVKSAAIDIRHGEA